MNEINTQRSHEIAGQVANFTLQDVTPVTNFDIAPEYTLIAHLPLDINNKLATIGHEIQEKYPDQYYYTPEQYHLTIVPVPREIEPARAIKAIEPIVRDWRLPICVRGLAINRFQSGAVLYPENETLPAKRAELRSALGIPRQAYTDHLNVWEQLLWVNILRFTHQPPMEMLELLRSKATSDIGSFTLSHYELYDISTKTLDPSSSTLLHTFTA